MIRAPEPRGSLKIHRSTDEVPSPLFIKVVIDGNECARIMRRRARSFSVASGTHTIQIRSGEIRSNPLEIRIEDGKESCVDVRAEYGDKVLGTPNLKNWMQLNLAVSNILPSPSPVSDGITTRQLIHTNCSKTWYAWLYIWYSPIALAVSAALLVVSLFDWRTVFSTVLALITLALTVNVVFVMPSLTRRRSRSKRRS